MDGGSAIYSLAWRCHEQFLDHVKKDNESGPAPFTRVLRECHYRFNAWASYLGVFAPEPASLDSRLKDATEVKLLVIDILYSIKDNLQLSLEPQQYHDGLPLSQPPPASSGFVEEPWGRSQIQNAVQRSIDRLERLGIAIRQSSTVSLQQRVGVFTKKKAKASFEELSLQIVRSMYPDADEGIISCLGRSIFLRYAKLRYKHEHQRKLALHRHELFEDGPIEERSLTPAPKPITAQIGTRPDEPLLSASEQPQEIVKIDENAVGPLLSDTLPSVFKGELELSQEPSKKTSSIIVRGATYPKPPLKESAPELKTCDWCFEIYKTTQFEDQKWWVRHVDRDLLPYICLSEDCTESMVQFERFEQWKKHMESKHTQGWTEHVYARKWVCDIDHTNNLYFDSLRLLKNHMYESHTDLFDDVQIKVLAEQSDVQVPRDQGICPLCCFPVIEDDQAANENQEPEDETPLTSTIKPEHSDKGKGTAPLPQTLSKKKVRFNISSEYSQAAAPSTPADIVGDTTTTLREQSSDKSIQQKVAMHIAKHLQTLCFFSLRLKALDEEDRFNSESQEYYESQGTVSTTTDSENKSRLADVENQEPLVFHEIDSLSGPRQDLLVPWNPELYVDITQIPSVNSTRSYSERATCHAPHDFRYYPPSSYEPTIYNGYIDIPHATGGIYGAGPLYRTHVGQDEPDILSDVELGRGLHRFLDRRRQSHTDISIPGTSQLFSQEGENEGGWDLASWLQTLVE